MQYSITLNSYFFGIGLGDMCRYLVCRRGGVQATCLLDEVPKELGIQKLGEVKHTDHGEMWCCTAL